MSSVARGTSLRAGGACVRCRKGKTKCVYENGRAPCKNCAKGMHECYLPSESMAHHHGQSPARVTVSRPRESLPGGERSVSASANEGQPAPAAPLTTQPARPAGEKLSPDLLQECERVINKMLPACVAFHKPSFLQKLKSGTLDASILNGLLTTAARSSPVLARRYGGNGGPMAAAEHFAVKTISLIMQNLDNPGLADIQALCLLIIHEWGSRNAVRAYIYLGQAARMAQMYRIIDSHRSRPEADQFIREESFRRTMWLIYILDCFLTSSPGRHPALSAHDIKDVALPCPDMSFNFGTPVYVRTLAGTAPRGMPESPMSLGDVGEFGHIVLATQAWRNVIEMLTTVTVETFSEQQCQTLENEIEAVRQALPMHFMDKPNHISLHITMGSGFTFALLHSLLHCATIMVNRRRLLQVVTMDGFNQETWRMLPHAHAQTVDRVFAACHSIISLLNALEMNGEKNTLTCFPLVMLFACFTSASTVAWFSLKGLTPLDVNETAEQLVRDSMHFLMDGAESWTLAIPWFRHLSVMAKVLRNGGVPAAQPAAVPAAPSSVKDDVASQPGDKPEAMDYERPSSAPRDQPEPMDATSEPRRSGFTTINGGNNGSAENAASANGGSPQPVAPVQPKVESPKAPSSAEGQNAEAPEPGNDMTAAELCGAFERQLLELDDLAAFMGGGV
ncbi:fungal specific transcription factor domain-containing protein [Apiospora saccharicola]|uniref:Fungal specific transcription factor domain-containing protein n=1 Tax=Apiospora saccharicola TaxID=335842 RepID=A0ABR1UPE2_9PEZI